MFWIFYWDSIIWILWSMWIIFITLIWLNLYSDCSSSSWTIWESSFNYTCTITSCWSIRGSYPFMCSFVWETSWFAIWSLSNNCWFWINLATSLNSYTISRCNLVFITFTIDMNSYSYWVRLGVIWISYSYFTSYILTSLTKVRFLTLSPFNSWAFW